MEIKLDPMQGYVTINRLFYFGNKRNRYYI